MSLQGINPYIILNGTAQQAIELYQSALGARAEGIMRFKDGPGCGTMPPELHNRIMHAMLHIGSGALMLSDTMPDRPTTSGTDVQVALQYTDPDAMSKQFHALAAGGKVTMPIQDMFWGAKFGTLTDAFGINWMFNCPTRQG